MERFRGSLSHYRLQLVIPALYEGEGQTGALTLERGEVTRRFYFQRGLLVSESSSAPGEHLAQILVRLGLIDAAQAGVAFQSSEAEGVTLGGWLLQRGQVSREALTRALVLKATEAFCDCYDWESGELRFEPGRDPVILGGVPMTLPLRDLHEEAMRRRHQWRRFRELFPRDETRFDVRDEGVAIPAEDRPLLELARKEASLADLLAAPPEGPLAAAQRVIALSQSGVLVPQPPQDVEEMPDMERLFALTREYLASGAFEVAAQVAAQALERAAVPEAQALFREADQGRATEVAARVRSLEGRLRVIPLPERLPASLTADDLYLYSKLKSAGSLRPTLESSAMGPVAAYRSLLQLVQAGLIELSASPNAGKNA